MLLAFTTFVLRLAEDAVRTEAEDRVRTTAVLNARLVAEQSQRFAEVTEAYAQRLRGLPAPRRARLPTAAEARIQGVLRALRSEAAGVDEATFTDPLGRIVAVDPPGPRVGADLSGTDWYAGLTAGRTRYLSRAGAGPAGPTTALAIAVAAPGGARVGTLVATTVNRAQGLADAAGADVLLTVTDQAGTVVGRTGRPPAGLVTRAQDVLVAEALAGRSGVRVREIDGRPTVSGYAPVPRTGWAVLADVPATRAFADVTRLRVTLLAGAAVVAFLLLWLVPLLALRLGRAREQVLVSERFQTDLLPADLPAGVVTHYVASEKRMLLGGDFLDAVRTPDGGLAVLVGDVCGHGPRAAALAARLRASWRTLATAGAPLERLDVLERIVMSERPDEDLFATVVVAHIDADATTLRWALAGHPPALLDADGVVKPLEGDGRGPALGLVGGIGWPVAERALPERWTLVLFSDGLIEAHDGPRGARLELEGLQRLVESARGPHGISSDALVAAVARVADAGGRGLDDDLALLVVDSSSMGRQHSDTGVRGVGLG